MNISGYFLFPGQGAQVVGMAQDCVKAGGYAKSLFEEADEALGFSLSNLVFSGTEEELAKTENCQPALLVASLAYFETLRERCNVEVTGASGLSLGEYTALVALDALDFADAVRLVRLPTTALAQGDSAVGVKNGVDYLGEKNFTNNHRLSDFLRN